MSYKDSAQIDIFQHIRFIKKWKPSNDIELEDNDYDCPYCGNRMKKRYGYCVYCFLAEPYNGRVTEKDALDKLRVLINDKQIIEKEIALAKKSLFDKLIVEEL